MDDVVQGDKFVAPTKVEKPTGESSVEGHKYTMDDLDLPSTPTNQGIPDKKPSSKLKLYSIYCEPCGYKKITDGSDVKGLIEFKTSPVPGGQPYRDMNTGEVRTPEARPQPKKFKCPNCGRVVTVRKVADSSNQSGRSYDD